MARLAEIDPQSLGAYEYDFDDTLTDDDTYGGKETGGKWPHDELIYAKGTGLTHRPVPRPRPATQRNAPPRLLYAQPTPHTPRHYRCLFYQQRS